MTPVLYSLGVTIVPCLIVRYLAAEKIVGSKIYDGG